MDHTLRIATADDFDQAYRMLFEAFNEDMQDDVAAVERGVFEPERTVLTISDDAIIGVAGAFTRDLSVPGAVLPAAHVSMVGVSATNRRQGVLTGMMRHQLADVARRGETIAVLWATEGRIYQRYGYGQAARRLILSAEREVQLRQPVDNPGRLRAGTPAQLSSELAKVYDRVRPDRPGWSNRDTRWWDNVLADLPSQRGGATALRALVHEGPDGTDGYALWRVLNQWVPGGGKNSVVVREVVAGNPVAYQALWHFLLNVDLTRETQFSYGGAEEPLWHLVNEPRRLNARLLDSLWLRLVDVPGALSGRRYASEVDVTIRVDDPNLPANSDTWHLVGNPDSARCVRATRPAELACDVAALGAAYLGGTSLGTLAETGRVRELVPGTLPAAAAAFGWHRAAAATEVF